MSLQLTETCFINLFRNYIINKTTFDMSAVEDPASVTLLPRAVTSAYGDVQW